MNKLIIDTPQKLNACIKLSRRNPQFIGSLVRRNDATNPIKLRTNIHPLIIELIQCPSPFIRIDIMFAITVIIVYNFQKSSVVNFQPHLNQNILALMNQTKTVFHLVIFVLQPLICQLVARK